MLKSSRRRFAFAERRAIFSSGLSANGGSVLGAGKCDALNVAAGAGNFEGKCVGLQLTEDADEVCGGLVNASIGRLVERVLQVADSVALGAIDEAGHAFGRLYDGLILGIGEDNDGVEVEFFAVFELPDDALIAELAEVIGVEAEIFVARKRIDGRALPLAEEFGWRAENVEGRRWWRCRGFYFGLRNLNDGRRFYFFFCSPLTSTVCDFARALIGKLGWSPTRVSRSTGLSWGVFSLKALP